MNRSGSSDEEWMEQAIAEARLAAGRGEVPVGAVAVIHGRRVAAGRNESIARSDPTAHAEILALRGAGDALGNYRLPGVTLFVTLEPCPMCIGAMIHARIDRLVFGAPDPRTGAAGSVFDLATAPAHNHRLAVTGGVCRETCSDMLRSFFRERRRPAAD